METTVGRGPRPAPRGVGGLLRNIGPGVVVSGSVVGSGELLVTTRMGAEVGFVFLWGVIVACLVKFFIQIELGRQTLLYGNSTVQILDRVAGGRLLDTSWAAWLCMAGYLAVMIAIIGILGSVVGLMITLVPALPYEAWAVLIFLALSLLLYRGLYNDLEKMVTLLVASFSLVVILSVVLVQGTAYAISGGELLSGLRFSMPTKGAFVALALMGSVGATAVELFMYPYWIREKGYPEFVGPRQDTPEWEARYRGWMRVVFTDVLVCTSIALVITCAYYLLGASILKKMDVLPQGMKVVEQVSAIFTQSIGGWAYYLFMFGGFCTLFSTLLVFTSSSGRIGVDFLVKIGLVQSDEGEADRRLLRLLQILFPFTWLCFILISRDTPFYLVLLGANANNLLLLPLAYGIVHLALRVRGRESMPWWWNTGLFATVAIIVLFTGINLYKTWFGG